MCLEGSKGTHDAARLSDSPRDLVLSSGSTCGKEITEAKGVMRSPLWWQHTSGRQNTLLATDPRMSVCQDTTWSTISQVN